MAFVKRNLLGIFLVFAVGLGFGIQDHDLAQNQKHQIIGCVSNSAKTTLSAAGQHELSVRVGLRGNPGDAESSAKYQAFADGLIATIARDTKTPNPHIADVDLTKLPGGKYKATLTETAIQLQTDGCVARYKG